MDKILKIQTEIGTLVKDQTNPYFKSKYLDINGLLEQLHPLLVKYGVTVVQPLVVVDGKSALATIVFEGDKKLLDSYILLPDIQDPQKMGSAITYYRRYALQSLFLLQTEDTDGEIGQHKKLSSKEISKKSQQDYDNGVDPF